VDVDAVADELVAQLGKIVGLRVYKGPPDSVSVPAAVVSLPERIQYQGAYRRGMNRITWPLVVLVARVSDRLVLTRLAEYCSSSGASSVAQVLEAGTWTACDVVTVMQAETDVVTWQGTDYAALLFDLEIVGTGA
jgi:hypothetical protein